MSKKCLFILPNEKTDIETDINIKTYEIHDKGYLLAKTPAVSVPKMAVDARLFLLEAAIYQKIKIHHQLSPTEYERTLSPNVKSVLKKLIEKEKVFIKFLIDGRPPDDSYVPFGEEEKEIGFSLKGITKDCYEQLKSTIERVAKNPLSEFNEIYISADLMKQNNLFSLLLKEDFGSRIVTNKELGEIQDKKYSGLEVKTLEQIQYEEDKLEAERKAIKEEEDYASLNFFLEDSNNEKSLRDKINLCIQYIKDYSSSLKGNYVKTRLRGFQDTDAWKKAEKTNKIPAYEAYLHHYPNGSFREEAQKKIIDLSQVSDKMAQEKQENNWRIKWTFQSLAFVVGLLGYVVGTIWGERTEPSGLHKLPFQPLKEYKCSKKNKQVNESLNINDIFNDDNNQSSKEYLFFIDLSESVEIGTKNVANNLGERPKKVLQNAIEHLKEIDGIKTRSVCNNEGINNLIKFYKLFMVDLVKRIPHNAKIKIIPFGYKEASNNTDKKYYGGNGDMSQKDTIVNRIINAKYSGEISDFNNLLADVKSELEEVANRESSANVYIVSDFLHDNVNEKTTEYARESDKLTINQSITELLGDNLDSTHFFLLKLYNQNVSSVKIDPREMLTFFHEKLGHHCTCYDFEKILSQNPFKNGSTIFDANFFNKSVDYLIPSSVNIVEADDDNALHFFKDPIDTHKATLKCAEVTDEGDYLFTLIPKEDRGIAALEIKINRGTSREKRFTLTDNSPLIIPVHLDDNIDIIFKSSSELPKFTLELFNKKKLVLLVDPVSITQNPKRFYYLIFISELIMLFFAFDFLIRWTTSKLNRKVNFYLPFLIALLLTVLTFYIAFRIISC